MRTGLRDGGRKAGRRAGAAALVAGSLALAGCSGADDPQPSPSGPSPTTTEPTTTGPTTPSPVRDVDCAAVEEARARLEAATQAELDRLEVPRGDPRAFSIQVIVTSQEAAEYWSALQDALGPGEPELRADAETVVAYWEPLDADLEEIEIPDGTEAAITEATERYVEISEQHPDEDVVEAQERLSAGLEDACSDSAG
ncbi:hypothetical protein ACFP6A_03420 [Quadrisphaera sp. GCM10027208]|uniref:hypothetical protein n=1 Tax=Quadrisphaera sp. GCM10027208 TaxID=3273423 RepID=UPI00361D748F